MGVTGAFSGVRETEYEELGKGQSDRRCMQDHPVIGVSVVKALPIGLVLWQSAAVPLSCLELWDWSPHFPVRWATPRGLLEMTGQRQVLGPPLQAP